MIMPMVTPYYALQWLYESAYDAVLMGIRLMIMQMITPYYALQVPYKSA